MPYNPKTEASVVIGKKQHKMLREIAKTQKRTLKATLNDIIEKTKNTLE